MPRELGERAAAGDVDAGLLPVADWFRLEDRFDRLGHFGIAVRGRVRSVLLFAMKPIRQLDGATIAITEETSTSARLLRLILEQRYELQPARYERGANSDVDARLLIGDEALRFQATNRQYPFETDLAFEWWLWQHLPFTFAVWAARKDLGVPEKRQLESNLARALGSNLGQLSAIAQEASAGLSVEPAELETYLSSFVYRLGASEEDGMRRFRELLHEHSLL